MHIQIAAISCPAVFQQSILRIFMQTLSFLFIIRFFALLQQHLTDCGFSVENWHCFADIQIRYWNRPADLIFAPTPAFWYFTKGLTSKLRHDHCRLAVQLTWVPLPVAGLDFQSQT
jgi:hypothetical protein